MHSWACRPEKAATSDGNRDVQPAAAACNCVSSARTGRTTAAVAPLGVRVVLSRY